MNINPEGMSVIDWADNMAFALSGTVIPARLDHPEKWREWAVNILRTPSIEGQNAPDPYQFENWRDWAMRFNQVADLPG